MLFSAIVPTLLLFGQALAAPAPQASVSLSPSPDVCLTPSYGSFKLYATRQDTGEKWPVRLFRENATDGSVSDSAVVKSYAIVNTADFEIAIYPCYSCGIIPNKWALKGQNLYALDHTLPSGVITVNQNVEAYGRLPFVGGQGLSPTAPIYCAEQSLSVYGHPLLSVHGNAFDFVMCRIEWNSSPSPIYTILYKAPEISIPEYRCYPIALTLE